MGLGSLDVSLKDARADAAKWRSLAQRGIDPIKERRRQREEAAKERPTLELVMAEAFEARKAELKDDGRAGRWDSPLRVHVLPKLGKTPIVEIDQNDIRNTLAPVWHAKPEAAKKALHRLRLIIWYGAAKGLDVDLQAADKAKELLCKQRRAQSNFPALSWREVPAFYQSLNDATVTQLAFRFLILTTARSAEVRSCHLDEIDGDRWVLPPERMKAGRQHVVPLSREALDVIEQAKGHARGGFLFPGRGKGVISDMTLTALLRRREMEARPHGFRSSFRTWCAEVTDTPREIAGACLAHSTSGPVESAYLRSGFLEQRRTLMQRWADFVCGTGAQVVQFGAQA